MASIIRKTRVVVRLYLIAPCSKHKLEIKPYTKKMIPTITPWLKLPKEPIRPRIAMIIAPVLRSTQQQHFPKAIFSRKFLQISVDDNLICI